MTSLKKSVSFLLCIIMLVCSFAVASPININSETTRYGFIYESGVNIRKDATTNSESITKVSSVFVEVLGGKLDTKDEINPDTKKAYIWYSVSYTSSTTVYKGYVREDLIKIVEPTIDPEFEKQLEAFPDSYKPSLTLLHALYPNWQFIADKVPTNFSESVALQDRLFYKLVQTDSKSWYSMRKGCYDWTDGKFIETDSGGWYGASREVIAFYMDPRNFLNPNDIYLYMKQSYDADSQTVEGIEDLVDGTFLDAKVTDKNDINYGKRYAEVIKAAGKQSKVNAYVLASTILQEQGTKGATLSKGTTYKDKTVYNFFNFGASGSNSTEVLNNGKKYAYEQGWFTPTDAIVQGAVKYGTNYISIGQDTYFYKNYNVLEPDRIWHQYAQNAADSLSTSKFLKTTYMPKEEMPLQFRIPVFEGLPEENSKLPAKSDKLNNYYFSDIKAEGLTPSFNRYTFDYSLSLEEDAKITVKCPSGAKYIGEKEYELKQGDNSIVLTIKSESGYTNDYTINVYAQNDCKLTITTKTESAPTTDTKVKKGDTNGDGKITTSDLANVRLHLLELIKLKGDNLKGADTNGDGKITTSDLANVRLHLLGLINLK